jgi:hypothetical protein
VTAARFLHPSGEVTLRELEVQISDGVARVRGMIDQADWSRLEHLDIFGARSRRRVPDELTGSGEVRITIEGPEEALDTGWQPSTEPFVIVDAMREIDNAELREAGLEGRAWQGVLFTAPAAWTLAVEALADEGFRVTDELDNVVRLRNNEGMVVEILALDETLAVTIEVRSELDGFGAANTADLLETLNAVNVAFPVSTNCIDGSQLVTKSGLPVIENVDLAPLIESLAVGLVQVASYLRPVVSQVARGSSSAVEALGELLG